MEEIKSVQTISAESICGNGFEFSPEYDKILPAFIEFQSKLGFAQKTIENDFFDAKYADISEVWKVIKKPLSENKLAIMQFPHTLDFVIVKVKEKVLKEMSGRNGKYEKLIWTGNYTDFSVREIMVTTFLLHESGQYVKAWYIETPEDNDHHAKGKAITYARRYSLMPILGIAPEDTDGNPTPKETPKPPSPLSHKKTPTTSATPTTPPAPQDVYVKDAAGMARYNKTKKQLNDSYQKENGLITTADWITIEALILQKIGGNKVRFIEWLKGVYSCDFYDIKQEIVEGIKATLQNTPEQVINYNYPKDDLPY